MPKFINDLTNLVYRTTSSGKFFVVAVLLFVFQSVWMAFTAIYPMPFDEFVHIGVIQLYARQWLPFIAEQPPGTGLYGDVTREPSFMFHYLMSFPYRVLDIFTDNEVALIIGLRLINIAFVVGGIIIFRKLLLEWGMSRRITHVALLLFVFTPIVPFLAAQVNYDNMMFLLTPIVLVFGFRIVRSNDHLVRNLALFVLTSGLTLIVKQTFLPLLIGVILYVCFRLWQRNRGKLLSGLRRSWKETSKNFATGAIIVGLLMVGGLVVMRYGGNVLSYGTFRPSCERVQPVSVCEDFGPWYRDHVTNVQNRPAEPPYGNPLSFTQYWLSRMIRGYFALFNHTPTEVVWDKEPYGPIVARPLLPIPVWVGSIVLISGLAALVWQWRRLLNNAALKFMLFVCGFYLTIVWLFNYSSYMRIWKAEAIQARYTYPILILLFVLLAQGISWSVTDKKIKSGLVVLLVLFYVWGGGIAGWLIRADDTWRWQNPTVQSVNRKVQTFLRHTVIH